MDVRTSAPAPNVDLFPPPPPERTASRCMATLRRDRAELTRFWPVVTNMVVQELRVRYQRSALGFLWTLLNPILMMTILTVVFSVLFKKPATDYAVYLFAGMVPWGFFAAALSESAVCIINNEGLIRKIYLPKLIFPLARSLINLVTFLLSLGALFLLMKPIGAPISASMLALPLVVALFFAFTLGLSMIVATANTFYRDCGHLVGVVLQAWYFATPIIYQIDEIPERVRWRFWLNPVHPFVEMFHSILSFGTWPRPTTMLIAAGLALVSLGVGYATFKSHEDKLVFRL